MAIEQPQFSSVMFPAKNVLLFEDFPASYVWLPEGGITSKIILKSHKILKWLVSIPHLQVIPRVVCALFPNGFATAYLESSRVVWS